MLGILGGTFDPIHAGHLHIAQSVATGLQLERVHFLPCMSPVHREPPRAGAEDRCAMIELAIADNPRFVLDRLEIERGGPSYSVDSLRQFSERNLQRLVLILGGDAFNGFDRWREPDEILRLAHLAVCLRPGVGVEPGLFAERRVTSARDLLQRPAGAILLLEVDAPDCASRSLRAAIAAGEMPSRCLPPAVAEYIETHQLYRKPLD